ncbi:23S ribosomal RNA methyltransferase Erm [Gracilibacillus timonensis]|uniref:23S ribosomal RNA methyltransferase Erm n=1 Tax=Gracilibacillus timonensis TaxID=1816696 RepID=UPI00098F7C32
MRKQKKHKRINRNMSKGGKDGNIQRGEPPNFPGQHLLHNKGIIKGIVKQASIQREETVIDFGAGKGVMTEAIAQKSNQVLAVEKDVNFLTVLERKFADNHCVKVIDQDILRFALPKKAFVVVSNIPYAITTPIMKTLLGNPYNHLSRALIVMEKGAAKRFTSQRIKDDYVLQWRMYFDIRIARYISKTNFAPPPKVDSALVIITRKKQPCIACQHANAFRKVVKPLLKKPDMPIGIALAQLFTHKQLKIVRKKLGVDNQFPIGYLSERQWGMIFETIVHHVPRYIKNNSRR